VRLFRLLVLYSIAAQFRTNPRCCGVVWSKPAGTERLSTGLKQLTEDGEAGIGRQRALSPGLKRGFHPNATHTTYLRTYGIYEITQATKWRHYWIGHRRQRRRRMPLARCQGVADMLEIIEIKLDLHRKLNNK